MTDARIQRMLDWQKANAGRIRYSQTDAHRLSYDDAHMLSPTDCSGLCARLYRHFAGINIGTYTGNEQNYGHLVTTSKSAARSGYGMLPGDLVFFDWDGGAIDHVAMYAGGGRIWNHGGPGTGPNNWSLANSVDNARRIIVRRIIPATPGTSRPPVSSGSTSNPMHGKPIPSLIVRGTGDYFGLITGPNESHGGAYATEQPYVKLIQSFLNWKMGSKLAVDGKFGPATAAAVTAFQKKYMPGTQFFGQVWFDDWQKMASL